MKQRLVLLVIASVLAIGSFFLTDIMVQAKLNEVAVIVAKRDIKADEALTTENVEIAMVSSGGVHPQTAKGLKQVLGKYSSVDLVKGQMLLTPQLQTTPNQAAILYQLRPEERVLAVHTDLVHSVGGTIKPGDWVDVVAVRETAQQEVHSRTILRRIRVVDVRTEDAHSITDGRKDEEILNTSNSKLPRAVLLALTAGQVEVVAAYDHVGEIVLSIHPATSTDVQTSGYVVDAGAFQHSSGGGQ